MALVEEPLANASIGDKKGSEFPSSIKTFFSWKLLEVILKVKILQNLQKSISGHRFLNQSVIKSFINGSVISHFNKFVNTH